MTTPACNLSRYTFTGQYSYMDDPSTSGVTEGFGLMFYNARWYDPALGRFAQADSIVPPGVQGLDRYAYVNNSPMNYTDPSGHICVESDGDSDVGMPGNCGGGSNPNYRRRLQGSPSGWTRGQNNSRTNNLPLQTLMGLPTNTCTSNSCTQPLNSSNSSNATSPTQYYCPPNMSCEFPINFGNYTYDIGFIYWSGEVNAINTFPGPGDTTLTLSNNGGEADHWGVDFDNSTFHVVNSTPVGVNINDNNYINYTYSSGVSFKQLAVNMTVEITYSASVSSNLSFSGSSKSELGVRPLMFAFAYAAYRIASMPKIELLTPRTFPG